MQYFYEESSLIALTWVNARRDEPSQVTVAADRCSIDGIDGPDARVAD
jgi:hypothetical protein